MCAGSRTEPPFPSMAQTQGAAQRHHPHSHSPHEFFTISTEKAANETVLAKETVFANEKLKDGVKQGINEAIFAKETIDDTAFAKDTTEDTILVKETANYAVLAKETT